MKLAIRAWIRHWTVVLVLCGAIRSAGGDMSFAGVRVLLIRPENSWGWDSALLGALEYRGIGVTWGEPEALEDAEALEQYDIVATTIKRRFTPDRVRGLTAYVRGGGSYYGSWGGPMGCPELLAFCGIERTWSVYIKELTVLEGPLSGGLGELHWRLPQFVGHTNLGDKGRELVAVRPAGGTSVARDVDGNGLGVIHSQGRGRIAVLGFGPENVKSHFRSIRDAAVVMDNLLRWLIPNGPRMRVWPGVIQVNLPARADIQGAWINGVPLSDSQTRTYGSLKQVTFGVHQMGVGTTAALRVKYAPLESTRNIETIIHMPATLRHFDTPAQAVDYVTSFHPTVVQPLLRGNGGYALYRGMPEDTADRKLVTDYDGDYLAEFIDLCHERGIKVIGGVYFAFPEPLRKAHPNAVLVDRDGKPDPKGGICFNRPEVQRYNFRTVQDLLDHYALDGVILDDNFELDSHPCYCDHCKAQFRAWCKQHGVACQDPATAPDKTVAEAWLESKRDATLALARRVRAIAAEHHVPAGGWVQSGMKPTYLATAFDFLGGMIYTVPAWSARGPLSILGDRGYITLLWGTDRDPAELEAEVVEAVRAGSSTVGFWILASEAGPESQRFHMRQGSFAAISRALARAEATWLDFYRDNLITGDARFAVTEARLGREELHLTVKNLGLQAEHRLECTVDLSVIEYTARTD